MEYPFTKGNWTVQGHSVVSDTADVTGFEERTGHIDREFYKGNILICESIWKPADAFLISNSPKMFNILAHIYKKKTVTFDDLLEIKNLMIDNKISNEP